MLVCLDVWCCFCECFTLSLNRKQCQLPHALVLWRVDFIIIYYQRYSFWLRRVTEVVLSLFHKTIIKQLFPTFQFYFSNPNRRLYFMQQFFSTKNNVYHGLQTSVARDQIGFFCFFFFLKKGMAMMFWRRSCMEKGKGCVSNNLPSFATITFRLKNIPLISLINC